MTILPENIIEKLIQIEAGIHYFESPKPGQMPFFVIERESPVIISAPHGAMTFRNNHMETWHEEDEYTAGMAILLSEISNTSVIATTWKTEDSDPNEHDEDRSVYKQELRRLAQSANARCVIDLHGVGEDNPRLFEKQRVELGTGSRDEYMPVEVHKALVAFLNKNLGKNAAYRNGRLGFRAEGNNRIARFSYQTLGLHSVQIEMKPSVRVPLRRENSSAYQKGGPYSALPQNVTGMLRSLVEFIGFLNTFTS